MCEIYLVLSFCFGNFEGEKIFIISPFLQLIYEVTLHKDMFLCTQKTFIEVQTLL